MRTDKGNRVVDQRYKAPPIIEAAIEIRFSPSLEPAELPAVSAAFASSYPNQETVRNIELALSLALATNAAPVPEARQTTAQKRTKPETGAVIVFLPSSVVVAQLAPYPGWGEFFSRFRSDWKIWKDQVGGRKITRVGVRFINRLDIPLIDNIAEESEYLTIYPQFPNAFGPALAYGLQVRFPPDAFGLQVTLNSANVPSPILGHAAIIFDQDVAADMPTSQDDSDMTMLLERMRDKKMRFSRHVSPKRHGICSRHDRTPRPTARPRAGCRVGSTDWDQAGFPSIHARGRPNDGCVAKPSLATLLAKIASRHDHGAPVRCACGGQAYDIADCDVPRFRVADTAVPAIGRLARPGRMG